MSLSLFNATLAAIHERPPQMIEHSSWCPRERRRIARWRTNLDHMERVLAARRGYLAIWGEMRPDPKTGITWLRAPAWKPGKGLRTTQP